MNKFKLQFSEEPIYGLNTTSYCFVKKVSDDTFKALHKPVRCKDYTHETIASFIHNKKVGAPLYVGKDAFAEDFSKLQLVVFLKIPDEAAKKRLYSVKKYLSAIEKECGVKQTLISEVTLLKKQKDIRAFLLTFDKIYVESPILFHSFIAFIRTLYTTKENITKANILGILNASKEQDYDVLSFVVKHDLFKLFMANHSNIIKDLTLNDIYPPEVTEIKKPDNRYISYHSGFGIVAACTHTLASKLYANKIYKLFEDNKIPAYDERY